MFRIAEKIAKKNNCKFLLTGENLSQVCSQTLPNLINTQEAVKIQILRPLLCSDKQEIIYYGGDEKCIGCEDFENQIATDELMSGLEVILQKLYWNIKVLIK